MKYRGRVILTAVGITAIFAGLGYRLACLHLKPSESTLSRISRGRHLEEETRGPRGQIFDRNGNILATDISAVHVCADPKFMLEQNVNIPETCTVLSQYLSMDRQKIWELLNQPTRQYVRIKKYMREKLVEPLKALKIKGMIYEEVPIRNYPKGVLGAHVIGFANHEGVGSAGIEQKFNPYLQGDKGLKISLKDGRRREIYSRRTVDIEAKPGADVYLTIDQQVQYFAEKALDELVEKYQPEGAWAIVQNVRTGEILAMASYPTYDPNRFSGAPPEWMRNRAIQYTYEPGSTMKAMVVASALDAGVINPLDTFDCENGAWFYGGRILHDSHHEGVLNVADILKKSSNIGAAKIALKLGEQNLYDGFRKFGFGSKTGIDLPGEEGGILWGVDKWSKISITRLAMGHEVNVTALQILSALSAIANDGIRMRPLIVSKMVDMDGNLIMEVMPEEIGRPISKKTAIEMRRLLARVTQVGGTGTKGAIKGYMVAGKTGTAQKVNLEDGGYYKHKYIASFAGFLPVENPAISIIVVADDPKGSHYGGTVCAPTFEKIADQAVRYLRISPQGVFSEQTNNFETNPLNNGGG